MKLHRAKSARLRFAPALGFGSVPRQARGPLPSSRAAAYLALPLGGFPYVHQNGFRVAFREVLRGTQHPLGESTVCT